MKLFRRSPSARQPQPHPIPRGRHRHHRGRLTPSGEVPISAESADLVFPVQSRSAILLRMKVGLFSIQARQRLKARERANDRRAAKSGQAGQRQARNRFLPNAQDWLVEKTPKPMKGEVLE
jgi:hypothetical protein